MYNNHTSVHNAPLFLWILVYLHKDVNKGFQQNMWIVGYSERVGGGEGKGDLRSVVYVGMSYLDTLGQLLIPRLPAQQKRRQRVGV